MKKLILAAAIIWAGSTATAGELDNEKQATNAPPVLEGTVILRIDRENHTTSVLRTFETIKNPQDAAALVTEMNEKFQPLAENKILELDHDGGASSWYFYWPGYRYGYGYGYPASGYANGYPGFTYSTGYYPYGYYNPYAYAYAPAYSWYGAYYRPYYSYGYGAYSYYYYGACGFCY